MNFWDLSKEEMEKLLKIGRLREAIEYAERQNGIEGLTTSPEIKALLEKVANGEMSFDEVRKIIDEKAKKLGAKNAGLRTEI